MGDSRSNPNIFKALSPDTSIVQLNFLANALTQQMGDPALPDVAVPKQDTSAAEPAEGAAIPAQEQFI
jgi:hypothetical protein